MTGWLVDHYSYVPVLAGLGLLPLAALSVIWFLVRPNCHFLKRFKPVAREFAGH